MSAVELFFDSLFSSKAGMVELRGIARHDLKPHVARTWVSPGDWGMLTKVASQMNEVGRDVYFGVASRLPNGGGKSDIKDIGAVWVDIDFKNLTGRDTQEIVGRIRAFTPRFTAAIATGGGLHIYWLLKEPVGPEDIPRVEAVNRYLAQALSGDPASTDAARILRVPGTMNWKYEHRPECKIVDYTGARANLVDFDCAPEDYQPTPAYALSSADDREGYGKLFQHCRFLEYCQAEAKVLPEPHWHAMISILVRLPLHGVVDKIHELSRPYTRYSRQETNRKILHVLNASTGPMKCRTISSLASRCGGCKVRNFISNPKMILGLKIEED